MRLQQTQGKTINNKKIVLIHIAKNKLNLTDEIYRDILWNIAKVNSSKDLSYGGFLRVLKRFRELGFRKTCAGIKPAATGQAGVAAPFTGASKQYDSSRKGLIQELEDVARQRWGAGFEKPLNAFINSHRRIPTHYKFLNVTFMKAIKERIKELNEVGSKQ